VAEHGEPQIGQHAFAHIGDQIEPCPIGHRADQTEGGDDQGIAADHAHILRHEAGIDEATQVEGDGERRQRRGQEEQ
jgi:hypothetical protein